MPYTSWPWQKPNGVSSRDVASESRALVLKRHLVATASELVGTFFFLLFGLGGTHVVNANSAPERSDAKPVADPAKLLYISLCFGLSLAVNVWAFFRIGGGMFNPAVAVAMFLIGNLDLLSLVLTVIAQLAGSIAAAALVQGLLGSSVAAATTLLDGYSVTRALFLEVFLTAQLILSIFMLATEKHPATAMAPVGIGLSLFVTQMMGVFYTGGSLNPARSFGPAVVSAGFPHYHWIYWVGPILGATLASAFYKGIKFFQFDVVAPGVDWKDPGLEPQQERHVQPTPYSTGQQGARDDPMDLERQD